MTTGPTITVGPVGSGADYTSADQTAFNSAVAALNAVGVGGGTIYVWRGSYTPSAEFVLTGTNIRVVFEGDAVITIPSTGWTKFAGAISPQDTSGLYCAIFVLGSATNCSVENLQIQCSNTTDGICGVVVAGGVYNCKFYNAYASGLTRWARFHTGYYTLSGMSPPTYDGGILKVDWYSPKSDSCGNNSVPDGGGSKFIVGSNSATAWVEEVTEFDPTDTNCQFASWDSNPGNTMNGNSCRNLERFGGYATFPSAPAHPCIGINVESAWARGSESVRIWGGKYDGGAATGASVGLFVGMSASEVRVSGTEFWNMGTGWQVAGVSGQPATGSNLILDGLKSIRCGTGAYLNAPNTQGVGTVVTGVRVRNCVVDDQGAQVTGIGLILYSDIYTQLVDLQIVGCDFSKVSNSGVPIVYGKHGTSDPIATAYPEARIRDVRGVTDQGKILGPFSTLGLSEIRASGSTATIAASTTYLLNLRGAGITAQSPGGTLTVYHPNGTTLGTMMNGGGSSPAMNQWYQVLYSGSPKSFASAPATGAVIYAIGPDGTVLVNGANSFPSLPLPSGTMINWGPVSVSASVTGPSGFFPTFALLSNVTRYPPVAGSQVAPWGTGFNFGTSLVPAPSITVSLYGSGVTNPLLSYRELSLLPYTGAVGSPSNGVVYEVKLTAVIVTCSAVTGLTITVYDRNGNTTLVTTAGLVQVRLDPGFRIQFSWTSTAPSPVVSTAPT